MNPLSPSPVPIQPTPAAGGSSWPKAAIAATILLGSATLLFARLGHYALWDDEAITALHAEGVWRTGDTSAVVGHNIVGYRQGTPLRGLRERYMPPLPSYLAALPVGLAGGGALAARVPFALCGLACVGLILRWVHQERVTLTTWALVGLAVLGNVSFFLYCRQCRYYSPAIFLSVWLTYLYIYHDGRRRSLASFALLSACLFSTNYINYIAFYTCLLFDYLAWGRRRNPLRPGSWPWLVMPQLVVCLPLAMAWNPFGMKVVDYQPACWLAEKATLLWWNCRDLARCEFGSAPLLIAAPVLGRIMRNDWLTRSTTALAVYVAVVTVTSPQPVKLTAVADVRYLAPVIPLCMAIGVLSLRVVAFKGFTGFALVLALLAFGTSILPGSRPLSRGQWSTIGEYIRELVQPPGDPYTVAAAWINVHVAEGRSVWVLPDHMTYPLMYHAPRAVYAWQFEEPVEPQFRGLDPIHYRGRVPPDYILAFGSVRGEVGPLHHPIDWARYRRVAVLDVFWRDVYRPELLARTFRPIADFDRDTEAIYIFEWSPRVGAVSRPQPGP
jgi:hypothetical protein